MFLNTHTHTHANPSRNLLFHFLLPSIIGMRVSEHLRVLLQHLHVVKLPSTLALKLDAHPVGRAEMTAQIGGRSAALLADGTIVWISTGMQSLMGKQIRPRTIKRSTQHTLVPSPSQLIHHLENTHKTQPIKYCSRYRWQHLKDIWHIEAFKRLTDTAKVTDDTVSHMNRYLYLDLIIRR